MICKFCGGKLKKNQTKFCSKTCFGLSIRGTGKSYTRIRVNGSRVYLHRYIFEQLVRPLEKWEVVHHKDENPKNNDPEKQTGRLRPPALGSEVVRTVE